MKSDLVRSVLQDELERNGRMISRYEEELESLPKGCVFRRKIGGGEYFYLNWRDGKKVVSKFLGKADSFDRTELEEKIIRRKEISALIKKLKIERAELQKAVEK
jgi:hypothetical protein